VCRGRVRRANSVRPSQVNEYEPQPQRNYAEEEEVDSDNLWGAGNTDDDEKPHSLQEIW